MTFSTVNYNVAKMTATKVNDDQTINASKFLTDAEAIKITTKHEGIQLKRPTMVSL